MCIRDRSSFYNGHKFKYDSSQEEEIMPESFMGGIGYILQEYGMSYLLGAAKTMKIALVGTSIGCLIGLAVGIIRTIPAVSYTHLDVYKRQHLKSS